MRVMSLIAVSLVSLSAQELPDAGSLFKAGTGNLGNHRSYQYTMEMSNKSETRPNVPPMDMAITMTVQAVNPGKYRSESKIGKMGSVLIVSDGKYLWNYNSIQNRYTKKEAGADGIEALLRGAASKMGAMGIGGLQEEMTKSARTIRSEFVEVDGIQRDCWVVESHPGKDAMPMASAIFATFWIDKNLLFSLKTSMSMKLDMGGESHEMVMTMITRSLKLDVDIPDSVFAFTPPPDAVEVGDMESGAEVKRAGIAPPAKPAADGTPEAFVPRKEPIQRTAPVYPEEARKQKLQGFVRMLVTINPQGYVIGAEVLTGPVLLRQSALDAVRQWKFQPVNRHGFPVIAVTQWNELFSLPGERSAPLLGHENKDEEMAAAFRIIGLESRYARTPEMVLDDLEGEQIHAKASARNFALPELAKAAVKANALDKATDYSNEMLSSDKKAWNFGTMIHDGNMVLGMVALRQGNMEQARQRLIEAGKTPGSPMLNKFGPNMLLAKEMLEKGEKDVVVEYFSLCKSFWKSKAEILDLWSAKVREGGIPNFSMNLR